MGVYLCLAICTGKDSDQSPKDSKGPSISFSRRRALNSSGGFSTRNSRDWVAAKLKQRPTIDYKMFLYVLKLEDECWYVGISHNPMKRARQHATKTKGSAWTRLHKPLLPVKDNVVITDLGPLSETACEHREDLVTEQMQNEYGLNKVRGGYTITCQNMKVRPPRAKAKWLYRKLKNRFRQS